MMKRLLVVVCLAGIALPAADKPAENPIETRIAASGTALQTFRKNATDTTRQLFETALCVGVVPRRTPDQPAGAFGFLSCRQTPAAAWSNPAAFMIEGGGVYWPVVGVDSDVVMLAMNSQAATRLAASEILFGSDLDALPGPTYADQGPMPKNDPKVFAYVSSGRGVSGVQLAGATMSEDATVNAAMFGRRLSNRAALQLPATERTVLPVEALRAALPASSAGVISEDAATAKGQ